MTKRKTPIALAMLIVGAGFNVDPATAASRAPNGRPQPAQRAMVIEHSPKAVWPLYSSLCEYKMVMNNADMRRCGIFLKSDPLATADVVRLDPRTIRKDR